MANEIDNGGQENQEAELDITELLDIQLHILDSWVTELNVPGAFVSDKIFPLIAAISPEYLETARKAADMNFKEWVANVEFYQNLPIDVRLWKNDEEKNILMDAARQGLLEKAQEYLRLKYEKNLESPAPESPKDAGILPHGENGNK